MDLVRLTESAYMLRGGSNAGLIVQAGRAILIDTGLDKDTAKKILRHVDTLNAKLEAVIITHAHADHFGGAATIKARTGARVYAPALEAAVVENPILEPLYLFSGAMPPAELRQKFTLGDACKVDELLAAGEVTIGEIRLEAISAPGHAPNQVMIAGGGACFVADAVFAPEVLAKHGIPFMVDLDAWLSTLAKVRALDGKYEALVPGHGPPVVAMEPWIAENEARLSEIRQYAAEAVFDGQDLHETVRACAERLGMTIPNLTIYLLAQTAILACLASLQASGAIRFSVVDNSLRLG